MTGSLKEKRMKQMLGHGTNGMLTQDEIKQTFKKFRIGNNDLPEICKELEKEGLLTQTIDARTIKFKIIAKLRL